MIWDQRPKLEVTHKPTGIKVCVRDRSLKRAKERAMSWLRSLVMAPVQNSTVIRKYEIDGPGGTRIKDLQTGVLLVNSDALDVLDRGEVDKLRG